MPKPTPELKQKLENALGEMFSDSHHTLVINDETIRKTFIDSMTGKVPAEDVDWDSVHKFIDAVDYMLGTLGYGICDLTVEGGPVPITEEDPAATNSPNS